MVKGANEMTTTKKKPTGLAAFSKKQAQIEQPPQVAAVLAPVTTKTPGRPRKRGAGDTVALTVRMKRGDWERLHALAVSEGDSLQALALRGFSLVFAEKGLPGVN
jgi:hypothetical protein